jgi:hypothetical protein
MIDSGWAEVIRLNKRFWLRLERRGVGAGESDMNTAVRTEREGTIDIVVRRGLASVMFNIYVRAKGRQSRRRFGGKMGEEDLSQLTCQVSLVLTLSRFSKPENCGFDFHTNNWERRILQFVLGNLDASNFIPCLLRQVVPVF